MASLQTLQSSGACRSTPGRSGPYLQSSCGHRVTPFTSRTRKWTKRTNIKQCVPWTSCSARQTTSRVYAAAVDEPQPEEEVVEEAEIVIDDDDETVALLEDDEFKPHSVFEMSEEQLQDRSAIMSTLAKSMETSAKPLSAEQEEEEQGSRDVAAAIVEGALELEQKFGSLRAASGHKESPLPFSDEKFWQEVEDDVETLEVVENFDESTVVRTDPFMEYLVKAMPPMPRNSDEEFHNDPDIVELRNSKVDADIVEYTAEEREVLSMLEGEEMEEEEEDTSPVLDVLTSLVGVPDALSEEEQQAVQEASSDPSADVKELLADKGFANVVDMAALASGLWQIPAEQTENVKWLGNKLTKAAAETTYSEVVASARDAVQSAATDGELQSPDVEAFKALLDEVAASVADSAADPIALPEGLHSAYNDTLNAISKNGFAEPVAVGDDAAVEQFLAEHKDQLQDLDAMYSAFSEISLPDEKTAREEFEELLLQLVTELDDPEITAAALQSDISVADAAAAKDVFLLEAKAELSEKDFAKVEAYFKNAFVTKVMQSGTAPDGEPEVPQLFPFPEIEGLDIGDAEADQVQPDFSKIPAEVDDADDSMLDDMDEDVVKWRNVKAELLRNVLEDEEDGSAALSVNTPEIEEGASAATMKMLMRLVEDAAEGRPLLKDFKLEDDEVDDEFEFPSVEATLAEIRKDAETAEPIDDSPVLQQLVPLLEAAVNDPDVETPAYQPPSLPENILSEDEPLELQDLYDPLDDFTRPVVNEEDTVAELEEAARVHEQHAEDLGLNDEDFDPSDDEFEADEKEKAMLAAMADVPAEDLIKEWVEGEGFLELGAPEPDLEAALAKAEAAAKAFEQSTSGLDDPTGLSDEDCQNLKIAFDNIYMIKAATSPQAVQLKLAAERLRVEMMGHRLADSFQEFVESTVTRGHLDDLHLIQFDEAALANMDDDATDQAMTDLVDKLSAVAEDKLVAAGEEALKDIGDVDLPEDTVIPENISEQFGAAILEKFGAERIGELRAEAEIQAMLENPRLLGLELDPVELAKGDDFDPEDHLADLKLLEASGVVSPVADEEETDESEQPPLLTVAEQLAAAEADADDEEAAEDEELVEDGEDSIEPPTPEGAIFADLVDQALDTLKKVDEDDLYFDDDVYDADADAEATAEQGEAELDEEEYDEDDDYDEDEVADMAQALDLQGEDEADEEEAEEVAGLVYTDSAAREGVVDEDDEDVDYGEEEGEGDVAPEDMRNEYNSFMSEELFGNPTFADIWEEMGIPEMRPKEPVRMDQEDYDSNAAAALVDPEDEAEETSRKPVALDEEGEEEVDVPIGNWFGDDDEGEETTSVEAEDVEEETSLEKLSKYYGGAPQSWEGLDKSDNPRADLDVFSGATYLDGGDDDDRAADDVTGLMERVTMTKEGVVFIERVIQVQRVTKVVKGGNIMSFRCTAVVGNRAGIVGVGIGSAREVAKAVQKAVSDAKKNVIMVPLTKYASIPHRVEKKFKASQCVINPAADGTGCIAGGAIRSVLELAGVKNCLAKQLGTRNPMNNAKVTIEALKDLQTWGEVAAKRNVPISYLFAQSQEEAERVLAEHRGGLEEEIF